MGELGSLLTRAREARGLTLEDAERDTRISRRYLQALEAEQFEVIPAPVYARGFLRSYSQYLGIDPQEALAMFPREEDPEYQRAAEINTPAPRASRESPVSPVSAARPTWRSPQPQPAGQEQAQLPQMPRQVPPPELRPRTKPTPLGRPVKREAPAEKDANWEPVIGVDIGVSSPANRIKTDPAAQTRSVVLAIVALGVILGAVLFAILISNLGGGDDPPPGTGIDATQRTGDGTSPTSTVASETLANVTPGIVPDLEGLQESVAKQMIIAAGYTVVELRAKNENPKGTVFDQQPAPEIEYPQGRSVRIAISDGP